MTRAQAVGLPLSLSAHAAGVAGLLAVSLLPGALPAARATAAPTPLAVPMITLPATRPSVAAPPSRPARSPARARTAGPARTGAAAAKTAPTFAAPGLPPLDEDLRQGEWPGATGEPGCVGCVVPGPGVGQDGPGGDGTAAGGDPVRVGGLIREPVKRRHVSPAYPDIARAARVQGTVVLECTLTPEGRVADLRIVNGHPLLASAAAHAVAQWLYQPTLLNGVPVPVIMTVTVNFALR